MELTEIQNFYKNKTIFVTGATGFLGKTLVEKLLRSCSELNKIILPIRHKKKENLNERIRNYFENSLFDIVKSNNPSVLKKVIFINSNLEEDKCGLNNEDYNLVKSSVNIIIHCAAIVQFNSSLDKAVNNNVKATKNIIEISKEVEHLESVVFTSTIWSHWLLDYVEEKVHKPLSYEPEFLINLVKNVDNKTLKKITSDILGAWPNTYSMSKYVSEYLVDKEKHNFPCAIFRVPGILLTYQEPFPGWMNTFQGVTMLAQFIAIGLIKVLVTDDEYNSHIIPVDVVSNTLIAVAWYTAVYSPREMKVYNVCSATNPLSRNKYFNGFVKTKFPLENIMWKPGYYTLPNSTSKKLIERYFFFYHSVPAYICDFLLKIFFQEPVYQKTLKKTNLLVSEMRWAIVRDFKFEYKNIPELLQKLQPEDKKIFNFDVNLIDWDKYLLILHKGIKQHLNEDFAKLEKCEQQRYLFKSKF